MASWVKKSLKKTSPKNLKIYLVNIEILKQINCLICTIYFDVEFVQYVGELNDYVYGNMAYEFENILYGVINSSKIKTALTLC